ncbi:MAG: transglycosylase domain-containing protein [Candidatus Pacebacteria bacterium]|nr:transglycosylase domain-containing protein [Candidatus Paceibacterota bacterium]
MNKRIKILFLFLSALLITTYLIDKDAITRYESLASDQLIDRNGKTISLKPNNKGNIADYSENYPKEFKSLLLKKEDQYFYYHLGFNPISIIEDSLGRLGLSNRQGSSTINQQLAKNLLGNENERDIKNKMIEITYAISLNVWSNKESILDMYLNSVYFGNQLQGLNSTSLGYFGTSPNNLTTEQNIQILSSINSPNANNPITDNNIERAKSIADNLNIEIDGNKFTPKNTSLKNLNEYKKIRNIPLELTKYSELKGRTGLTIDKEIDTRIKESIKKNIEILETKKAKNAAAIIISFPNNEIISMTGSPDPSQFTEGYQINMLERPRQIGSTIKPFIYLKGFEKGMRPYTILDDKEYKFRLSNNSPFYPKNYDSKYHGKLTAHYALSNSINVPALLTLNYVGIDEFGKFLEEIEFKPHQDIKEYQLGIAMGALEMTPKELASIFTIFPNNGHYNNLQIIKDNQETNKRFEPTINKQIIDESYIQLINKILNDRKTSIDQFGASSSLNLPIRNYALKTGTSHDYTDSLIVGYTPDFLVAVWVGNADSSETEGVSGQIGAGFIWNDIMQIMINSPYNKKTPLDFSNIKDFSDEGNIQYGLESDDYEKIKNLFEEESSLISWPQDEDIFLFDHQSTIFLKSEDDVIWYVDDKKVSEGKEYPFKPQKKGYYKITASFEGKDESIHLTVD